MPASYDPAAYADCFGLFDLALGSDHGIRKLFPSYDEAYKLQARMNNARTADKVVNRKLHPPEDPMHGSSIYMQIRVRIYVGNGGWYLHLEKVTSDMLSDGWEEIGEEEENLPHGPS